MAEAASPVALGPVCLLKREFIRPCKDQPRKYFDPAMLESLKESILEIGQQDPIWVRKLTVGEDVTWPHQYEIIDGERRYRACGLGNVPTMIAQVRTVASSMDQFTQSVVANFGSVGHTPLEIANAIARLKQDIEQRENPERAVVRIARACVKSTAWVYQHLSLLRLDPKVQQMMDPSVPEKHRLKLQVAITLANLPSDRQIAMAEYVTKSSLGLKAALSYVRVQAGDLPRTTQKGRRGPFSDYRILFRFAAKLREETDVILAMSPTVLDGMFKYRPAKHLVELVESLERRRGDLERICKALRGVEQRRDKGLGAVAPSSSPKSVN